MGRARYRGLGQVVRRTTEEIGQIVRRGTEDNRTRGDYI